MRRSVRAGFTGIRSAVNEKAGGGTAGLSVRGANKCKGGII